MIYIFRAALQRIVSEVSQANHVETGGILLGVRLLSGDFIITHATSPGPNAVKMPCNFQKDVQYNLHIMNILYRKYSVDYLGEWHKHPNNHVNYSSKDSSSMLYISKINRNPCFFIIVGDSYYIDDLKKHINLFIVNNFGVVINDDWQITDIPEELAEEKGILS
ncbi:MAG: Mov34/MPN/PAD-1 family protein [Parabacteroides sp.]|nr:Mov34/MPN/PAD-1 family protein [Eubacteriales bacterium]MDD4590658.1 Mov34/MPN/PAD-1 family protein [Parabacteroides sp.]